MENVKLYRCCNTCAYKIDSFDGCSKAGECYNGFSAYSPNAEMRREEYLPDEGEECKEKEGR